MSRADEGPRHGAALTRQAQIFQQAPGFIAVLQGPEHVFEFVNRAYVRLAGERDFIGRPAREVFPEVEGQGFLEILDQVYATGQRFTASGQAIRLARRPGEPAEERRIDFVYAPVLDEQGRTEGVFVEGHDVTDAYRAQESLGRTQQRLALLIALNDRFRELEDPSDVSYAAAELLGKALGVSRAGYGAVDTAAETITIERDWNAPGVRSLAGVLHFRDYGSYIEDLKRGETVVFADARTDPRTAATADALEAISARSVVNMPVWEQGGMVALLYLNHAEARAWGADELALVREVAERTRTAVERRRAEHAARELASRLSIAQRAGGIGSFELEPAQGRILVSEAFCRLWGLPVQPEYLTVQLLDRVLEDDRGPIRTTSSAIDGEALSYLEYRIRRADTGEVRWMARRGEMVEEDGRRRYLGVCYDITDRKSAEEQLRRSEAHLSAIFESATVGMSEVTLDGRLLRVNDELCRMLGRSRDTLLRESVVTVTHPEDMEPSLAAIAEVVETGRSSALDKRYLRPDGSTVWANSRITRLPDADGSAGNLLVVTVDLTDRKAAEQRLQESEARFRLMADAVPQVVWITDGEGRMEFLNRQFTRYTGASYEAFTPAEMAAHFIPQEDGEAVVRAFERSLHTGEPFEVEHRIRSATGELRWFVARAEPYRDPASGRIVRWFGASTDIHDLKEADARLRELNETLEERVASALAERKVFFDLIDSSDASVMVLDLDYRVLAINSANVKSFERIYGRRPRVGDRLPDLLDDRPAQADQLVRNWSRALAGEEYVTVQAFGDPGRDRRYFEVRFGALRNGQGRLIGASSTAYDVTDRIRAEQQLEAAQEQLRQSQKMEAMGQLTGGVAHDFNNLLMPIVGSLDMLQRRGLGGEREQRLIAGAIQSAERARVLVQRLLAFARRQPLQPVAVDVGELVEGMGDLVSSTTGPQIKVVVERPADLPPAKADPNQLEMALLNLAVNARDAMPEGGVLRITAGAETVGPGHGSGLPEGGYIRLSVADTGAGMSEAVLARAVEPFFSTKGVGKGTGLGLSMAHGLASQLGGALTIQSRLGLGTNVELWLPQTEPEARAGPPPDVQPGARLGRGRTLLVDDEELVRMTTADMLTDLGYEVVEAASGEEAMRLLESGQRFDLVVSDHLMPGLSGADLARTLRLRWPALPVLLVSGYAEVEGVDPALPRLAKPFRKDELAASLAAVAGAA